MSRLKAGHSPPKKEPSQSRGCPSTCRCPMSACWRSLAWWSTSGAFPLPRTVCAHNRRTPARAFRPQPLLQPRAALPPRGDQRGGRLPGNSALFGKKLMEENMLAKRRLCKSAVSKQQITEAWMQCRGSVCLGRGGRGGPGRRAPQLGKPSCSCLPSATT